MVVSVQNLWIQPQAASREREDARYLAKGTGLQDRLWKLTE